MIWDVFPFFNEIELLEVRLIELEDVVDRWVLQEGPTTYSGRRKPLYFKENRKRFSRWIDRIEHQIVGDGPCSTDPWENERWQRNMLKEAFSPADDDIISYTDADEIPRTSVYRAFNAKDRLGVLSMALFVFYLNTRKYERDQVARICTGARWKESEPFYLRFREPGVLVGNGGWHFTWMGTRRSRMRKAVSTSHIHDKVTKVFLRQLEREDAPGVTKPCKIDARWPKAIVQNQEKYREMGWILPC